MLHTASQIGSRQKSGLVLHTASQIGSRQKSGLVLHTASQIGSRQKSGLVLHTASQIGSRQKSGLVLHTASQIGSRQKSGLVLHTASQIGSRQKSGLVLHTASQIGSREKSGLVLHTASQIVSRQKSGLALHTASQIGSRVKSGLVLHTSLHASLYGQKPKLRVTDINITQWNNMSTSSSLGKPNEWLITVPIYSLQKWRGWQRLSETIGQCRRCQRGDVTTDNSHVMCGATPFWALAVTYHETVLLPSRNWILVSIWPNDTSCNFHRKLTIPISSRYFQQFLRHDMATADWNLPNRPGLAWNGTYFFFKEGNVNHFSTCPGIKGTCVSFATHKAVLHPRFFVSRCQDGTRTKTKYWSGV